MRKILTLLLFHLCLVTFAQQGLLSRANILDYYVFNNTKDTIYLTTLKLGQFTHTDSMKIVDSIQIDGIGLKEIIFVRYIHGNSDYHGGMFDIEDYRVITKYEIWNLDTKSLLFEAISDYKNDFNNSYAYDFQLGYYLKGKGCTNYQYDFTIDNNGQICISNLKKTVGCSPDHSEGLYRFINGKYTIE